MTYNVSRGTLNLTELLHLMFSYSLNSELNFVQKTGSILHCHYIDVWFSKAVLIFGWVIFAYVAYETSQVQIDFTEFDPYMELGIDRVTAENCLRDFIRLYFNCWSALLMAASALPLDVCHLVTAYYYYYYYYYYRILYEQKKLILPPCCISLFHATHKTCFHHYPSSPSQL